MRVRVVGSFRELLQITRVRRGQSVLRGASHDLERDAQAAQASTADQQQALAFVRSEEKLSLLARQPKARVHCANALGFLFQQKDHRSVLEHRLAVLALGKVLELLAERYQAEVVLACSTSEICQEGSSFGMAEQRGCFVDD